MQAGQAACTCTTCGVVCNGRFESCSDVWARGPVTLIEAPMRPPPRPAARRREVEVAAEPPAVPVRAEPASAEPTRAEVGRPDALDALAWLRREFAGLHARLEDLSDRVARQEATLAEVANDQASEINLTLADLESCAGELRNESQHLRDLREAMTEAVPPMVDAAARHAVATTTGGLATEVRNALAGVTAGLPGMVDASVKQALDDAVGDIRAALSGMVETSVHQAIGPAVDNLRGALAPAPAEPTSSQDLVDEVQRSVRESVAEVLGQTLSQALARRPVSPSVTPAASAPVAEASTPVAQASPAPVEAGVMGGPPGPAVPPPVEPPPAAGLTSPPVAAVAGAEPLPGIGTVEE
ncbi:MAG: hypothetical protein M3179_09200, partial [Actinomycetota bacterium]|nr:hypothetical protein [Actinomycetota bacterium]